MIRQYDYQCKHCEEFATELREMDDVYVDFLCPTCGLVTPGREAKKILTAAEVKYKQGRVKGRCNSYGR